MTLIGLAGPRVLRWLDQSHKPAWQVPSPQSSLVTLAPLVRQWFLVVNGGYQAQRVTTWWSGQGRPWSSASHPIPECLQLLTLGLSEKEHTIWWETQRLETKGN